ncbi:stage III sporulation protein AA [Camelliibacillus cellulosilyticus]|uniref:Stage III sporulation protein AA n=1 Tax=Camelliibacillus cellulosilyticus TaxID=2174486 RepID=A0ABV9GLC8_9BACL
MEAILNLLPQEIRAALTHQPQEIIKNLEEIRLRVGKPIELITDDAFIFLDKAPRFTERHVRYLLDRMGEYSLYTLEEELKRGYITIRGGHRVGLAGKVVTEKGDVRLIRDISSFNIRIARQKIGAASAIVPYLFQSGHPSSTLIIGPPQTGKTTLLRDLARIASSGEGITRALKVAIVDERSEIAGCLKGVPQNQFGPRIDVLDACPKAEGMMMMVRSMSPHLLVVDEIGRKEDTEALLEAVNAGVAVVASVHADHYDQLKKRPSIQPLLDGQVFSRYILLSRRRGPGSIEAVLNANGESLHLKVLSQP